MRLMQSGFSCVSVNRFVRLSTMPWPNKRTGAWTEDCAAAEANVRSGRQMGHR